MQNVPKVIHSLYVVKIDGVSVYETESLRSARQFLQNSSKPVKKQATIIRRNVTETVINQFNPVKITKTLLKRVA